jgi:hypothetical protein
MVAPQEPQASIEVSRYFESCPDAGFPYSLPPV